MKPYCIIAQRGGWYWIYGWYETYSKAYMAKEACKRTRIRLEILASVQGQVNL